MTDREKEIRKKIAAECEEKGKVAIECYRKEWQHNYETACSERYDFLGCPDEYECLNGYAFSAICDEISNNMPCQECWKYFLENDLAEKL